VGSNFIVYTLWWVQTQIDIYTNNTLHPILYIAIKWPIDGNVSTLSVYCVAKRQGTVMLFPRSSMHFNFSPS